MNSSSIIIPNVHDYVRRGMDPSFPERLLAEWRDIASGFSEVSLFWEGNDKLVLSPREINKNFISYIKGLLGYENLLVLVPRSYTSDFCDDILGDETLFSKIVDYSMDSRIPHILSWGATETIYLLLNKLQNYGANFLSQELPDRNNYWTSLYFDSKAGFRELCSKLQQFDSQIQIPQGFACGSLNEALEILRWFYSHRTPCVIKASSGVSGFGNVFIYGDSFEKTFKDVASYVKNSIQELPYFTSDIIIVEEMVISNPLKLKNSCICSNSPFMSGFISPDGEMKIIGGGIDIRNEQCYYVGAELGKEGEFSKVSDVLNPIMYKIGKAISEYGYRGHWGVNFVLSKRGMPIAIELNARRCGESHVYAIAKRIYGEEWIKLCYAITRFPYYIQPAPDVSIDSILHIFERTNAVYKKDDVMAIPTQVSWLHQKYPGIGYVLFGPNKSLVKSTEEFLLNQFLNVGIKGINGQHPN